MRVFCAALIVASLVGPVLAQDDHVPRYREKPKEKSQAEINADKAAARAYQNSLNNIPDQGPVDPWSNARSTDAPKSAAKPMAKSAAKAASAKARKAANTD
ncbi:MAG: hypothetical protein KGK01_03635 [Bradyrhizobium sp.]|uniref:hypothetical protein n=1 Tax=Bradyrhizobium sp. TaxID=376 RepID=UPI001C294676|nr:hypothetical protein [Bradyrhizobium sp.]MBU6462431.1 hypothetical protein [Pseudomonadota bacterium]MDE2067765.1 hypothetical protein [Bradyrhizobium sp.]MDE2241551.1 hypothetical protein [Bradyrhizobium sp.]MDE2472607.1 hypothetical protein [Bradyrhizobium sp.]